MIVWKTAGDNIPHLNDVVMVTREGLWSSALAPQARDSADQTVSSTSRAEFRCTVDVRSACRARQYPHQHEKFLPS